MGAAQVKGIPVEEAVRLIREKISSRVGGKKDGMQRAFKIIDVDGSGTIDGNEVRGWAPWRRRRPLRSTH